MIDDNTQNTPKKITTKQKKIVLCNSTIPVKPGAALSWKPICQGCGASLNIVLKRLNNILN